MVRINEAQREQIEKDKYDKDEYEMQITKQKEKQKLLEAETETEIRTKLINGQRKNRIKDARRYRGTRMHIFSQGYQGKQ